MESTNWIILRKLWIAQTEKRVHQSILALHLDPTTLIPHPPFARTSFRYNLGTWQRGSSKSCEVNVSCPILIYYCNKVYVCSNYGSMLEAPVTMKQCAHIYYTWRVNTFLVYNRKKVIALEKKPTSSHAVTLGCKLSYALLSLWN